MLWTGGSVPFPFGKGGSGVLAKCLFFGIEATLFFSAGPVCSSFSAEACAILHSLLVSATCKSATSLPLSFYLTLTLSSPPCPLLHLFFYFKLSGRSGRNCLLSPPILLYKATMGPRTLVFSRGTMRLMSWPNGERCSSPL